MPRCRCSVCGHRKTLTKCPNDYVRVPACDYCHAKRWRVDKYRNSGREQKGHTCTCLGYSFPHYAGRGWCEYNPAKHDTEFAREFWA